MTHRHFSFLIVALCVVPRIAPPAQQAGGARPTFRTLASFTGERFTGDPQASPDGRFVLLGTKSNLRVYDVATRRAATLSDQGAWDLVWAPQGDRIAWIQGDDGVSGSYVWSMQLDAKTAAPRGRAQRVTLGQSSSPSISFDGQWIAFCAPDSQGGGRNSPRHLSIVPFTGGPERVIAHFDGGFEEMQWSRDGKSLYFQATLPGAKSGAVVKVYLDGRPTETIRTTPGEWMAGMTSDSRHIVLVPAKSPVAPFDSATIIDTTGKVVGRVALPVGTVTEYGGVRGDSVLLWVTTTNRRHIETRAVKGGAATRIPLIGDANFAPSWSPDGKRMAFQVHEGGRTWLALMDADGKNVHVFRETDMRSDQWGARWSPDSKTIGFSSADWHQFLLLDVGTRQIKEIFADTAVRIGNWIWRPDGKSVASVMLRAPSPAPMPDRRSVDEITMSGSRRTLLELSALPGLNGFSFIDGSTAYVRSDSSAFVVSLVTGTSRRLTNIPLGITVLGAIASPDGRFVATAFVSPREQRLNQIDITSSSTGERRVIRTPFTIERSATQPAFFPDDRAVLLFGTVNADTMGTRLYIVPLTGEAPRALALVGKDAARASASISPNGASVAYTVEEARTTSLLEVDLRPVLRPSSRAPRR